MPLREASVIDEVQLRGALRALREFQLGEDVVAAFRDPAPAARGGPIREAFKPWRIARIAEIRARIVLFLGLACLASVVPLFSEGHGSSVPRPVREFRSSAGGSIQRLLQPPWPEKDIMKVEARSLLALVLTPPMALLGRAQAGDASFLPTDTISIQGVPNLVDDFTIECRVWIPSGSEPIIPNAGPYPSGNVFHAQQDSAMDTGLMVGPDGIFAKGPHWWYESVPHTMPKNQWCHVAVVRRSTAMRVYVDGVEIGSIACSAGAAAVAPNADVRIGAPVHNRGGLIDKGFLGRIDWLRLSSVARYTSNFTVPSEESLVPADAATELLLRFNEAPGASQVRDDSPHHFASVVGDPSKFPIGTATAPRFPGPTVCPSDLDGDGEVNGSDISLLLLDFGPCP